MIYDFNNFLGGFVLSAIAILLVWCLVTGLYYVVCLWREYLAEAKQENFLDYLEKTQKHKLRK